MVETTIRKGTRRDAAGFMGLLLGLAKFEHLEPPSAGGRKRLIEDIFARKRLKLLVALEGAKYVGYALYFYTYSSFLARPTLYLEDLFVLGESRRKGVGFALFRRCVDEAMKNGCGRMEWAVLTWNQRAMKFYEKLGARRLDDWYVYRMGSDDLRQVPRSL